MSAYSAFKCLACWQPRYNEEISFNVQKVSKYDQEMPPIVQCRPTQGTMRKGHREYQPYDSKKTMKARQPALSLPQFSI